VLEANNDSAILSRSVDEWVHHYFNRSVIAIPELDTAAIYRDYVDGLVPKYNAHHDLALAGTRNQTQLAA
jgi:hypothetical protein